MRSATYLKERGRALARWLDWLECRTVHQKVEGSIPGQGIYLGCRFNTWLGSIPWVRI